MIKSYFKGVTLLITHYNRSSSLSRLLAKFEEFGCVFDDIVVSDDGSQEEHIIRLKSLQNQFNFRLIKSKSNSGLANNINKGQNAVSTPFTLYVQEDFVPLPIFKSCFSKALNLIEKMPNLDIIRLYAYHSYPYLSPLKDGFSEMIFRPCFWDYNKIYVYSDHPHLRKSDFLQKFGPYQEGLKGDRTEYRMCLNFIQKKGRGLFYNDYQSVFSQENSEEEPSTMTRSKWTQSDNFFIKTVRFIYRQLRYNYDILFSKSR
jgi:glycosyltransferase involved in cell wall biosynthesis